MKLKIDRTVTPIRQITGNMKAGEVFVGRVYPSAQEGTPLDPGVFIVVCNKGGHQYPVNLETGKMHEMPYVEYDPNQTVTSFTLVP